MAKVLYVEASPRELKKNLYGAQVDRESRDAAKDRAVALARSL